MIGAGASGLVTCGALLEGQVDVVCMESGEDIAGLWAESRAYDCLTLNSSKLMAELPNFTWSEGGINPTTFPTRAEYASYLHAYARRFGINERVRLGHRVVEVAPLQPGPSSPLKKGWKVVTEAGGVRRTELFDAVIVCTGHFEQAKRLATHERPSVCFLRQPSVVLFFFFFFFFF